MKDGIETFILWQTNKQASTEWYQSINCCVRQFLISSQTKKSDTIIDELNTIKVFSLFFTWALICAVVVCVNIFINNFETNWNCCLCKQSKQLDHFSPSISLCVYRESYWASTVRWLHANMWLSMYRKLYTFFWSLVRDWFISRAHFTNACSNCTESTLLITIIFTSIGQRTRTHLPHHHRRRCHYHMLSLVR